MLIEMPLPLNVVKSEGEWRIWCKRTVEANSGDPASNIRVVRGRRLADQQSSTKGRAGTPGVWESFPSRRLSAARLAVMFRLLLSGRQ